jgi:hypothetical protein
MKNPQKPNDLPPLPDQPLDLSEEIAAEEEEDELQVEDADILGGPAVDPELPNQELEQLTTWDEAPGLEGRRVSTGGTEDESEYARQMVETGSDLADSERRDLRERDEMVEEAEEAAAESGNRR